jgi:hypothetical protein
MTDTADKRRINVEITNRSIGIVEIFLGRFRTSIARLVEGRGDQPD